MRAKVIPTLCLAALIAASLLPLVVSAGPEASSAPAAMAPAPKSQAFEALRALAGNWVATDSKPDEKPLMLSFKSTAAGSALVETLFPGSDHEMMDLYTIATDNAVVVTHYCAMGNQPRMKLASFEGGVLKFEFIDAGNLKSRDLPHMDSLEITIGKDTLVEKWSMYQDGKITSTMSFEFKRQK